MGTDAKNLCKPPNMMLTNWMSEIAPFYTQRSMMQLFIAWPIFPPDSSCASQATLVEHKMSSTFINAGGKVSLLRNNTRNHGFAHFTLEDKSDATTKLHVSQFRESCSGFRNSWCDLYITSAGYNQVPRYLELLTISDRSQQVSVSTCSCQPWRSILQF